MSEKRKQILDFINLHAGFRLANVQNGTATQADKDILDEALGFRSLCLFSCLTDKQLKELWEKSGLEYIL